MRIIPCYVVDYARCRVRSAPPGFVLGLAECGDGSWVTIEMLNEAVPTGCRVVALAAYDFEKERCTLVDADWIKHPGNQP